MKAFYRALGGPGRLLEDFLNGTWLGHSLHAVLVDVVIGSATAALFLDVLRVIFGVSGLEDARRRGSSASPSSPPSAPSSLV